MRRIAGLLLLAAACSRGYRDPGDSAELERAIDDKNLATRVRVALGEDPQTAPYDMIVVSCEEGVVTLAGPVDRAQVKRRAAEVAQTVGGVVRVENEINVRDATSRR
jgi:osmotically-inducible protein OsmY